MNDHVALRPAVEQDAGELTGLKVHWSGRSASPAERELLRSAITDWLRRGDVVCVVAEARGRLVGMAWMVIFERVPDLGDIERRSADVQSVFILPSHRGRGLGEQLVGLLLTAADQRGIPRVIVHSSAQAIDLYRRAGFESPPVLLQREAS